MSVINIWYSYFFQKPHKISEMANELETREKIIRLIQNNPQKTYKTIAREMKVCIKTVCNVVKRFKGDLQLTRKIGSGRKSGFRSPKRAAKVESLFRKNPGVSTRKAAAKAGCSNSLIQKIKQKAGLKSFKVQKVPDRNAVKNIEAKQRGNRLKIDFFSKLNCCIMDDETYVLANFSQLPGQEFYVADSRGNVEEQYRTQKKSKFPRKFLVWQAICTCGRRSQPFVTSGTINTDVYIRECLQKRLLPFYNSHGVSRFFWPDLASCHYSRRAVEWYEQNNVRLVPREANPPNSPELRPIERYWALVKKELKATKKVTRDLPDFKFKWRAASRSIGEDTIKSLMEGIPEKLNKFIKS